MFMKSLSINVTGFRQALPKRPAVSQFTVLLFSQLRFSVRKQ
jgi:hypothetical protein